MRILRFLAIAVMALLPHQTQAATVTFTNTVASPTDPQTIAVSQFDSALGTLTGAEVAVSGNLSGTLYRQAFCGSLTSLCTFHFSVGVGLSVVSADLAGLTFSETATYTTSCTVGPLSPCFAFGLAQLEMSASQVLTDLVPLIGSGSISFLFEQFAVPGYGNPLGTGRSDYSVSITYSYEAVAGPAAVPLPASLPLLAAGMGGLALLARRRRA